MRVTQTPFHPAAAATAIQALRASIGVPDGVPYRRRTIDDVTSDAGGFIAFPALRAEIERVATEAGLEFHWIAEGKPIEGEPSKFPRDWTAKFRRIDVSVTRGLSEGWILRITGAPAELPRPGEPDRVHLIAQAKFLGSRWEGAWLAVALGAFFNN